MLLVIEAWSELAAADPTPVVLLDPTDVAPLALLREGRRRGYLAVWRASQGEGRQDSVHNNPRQGRRRSPRRRPPDAATAYSGCIPGNRPRVMKNQKPVVYVGRQRQAKNLRSMSAMTPQRPQAETAG